VRLGVNKDSEKNLEKIGKGMSAVKAFIFVIPSRPQPRLRGEDGEESAFFQRSL
jgi:hypothetical protein